MADRHYDGLVIGSGPGGEGAAMMLAKNGGKIGLVEKFGEIGGGCTPWGTIPSKSLRQAVQQVADYRNDPLLRRVVGPVDIAYPDLLKAADSVIAQQTRVRERFYYRNGVDVISGHARFVDEHSIEVETERGASERYSADHFVIASGSRPYHPDDVDFEHPRVHDSDSILRLDFSPRSITIYGAGVVGCEYASIFANFGLKVNLVNVRKRLLAFLDDEITDALGYHLRNQGVVIRNDEEYARVEGLDDGVVLHCQSGKRMKSDVLLWANGRTGNSQDMGLEALGLVIDHRGQIAVSEHYQTSKPHIYAVGDVVGPPSLASASYDQGRFAATHIVHGTAGSMLVSHIPTGIYTKPEISSLGPTEYELTEQKVPYEVGRAMFRSIARAQITGHTVGMVKLLFHTESLAILGIHCFGEQACEIVHIGQAIMSQPGGGNTLKYFVETTFNYPTMAEAYRVAALNGLNRVF
jgi:NAD(P) transhydrogenase